MVMFTVQFAATLLHSTARQWPMVEPNECRANISFSFSEWHRRHLSDGIRQTEKYAKSPRNEMMK